MQDQNSHREFLHAGKQIPPAYFLAPAKHRAVSTPCDYIRQQQSLGTCSAQCTDASSQSEQDVRDNRQKKLLAILKQVVIREK